MKSKGGKIEYRCPECRSSNIHKCKLFEQVSYGCDDCNRYGPWRDRIKESLKASTLQSPPSV
jgi:transposase-like protein